MKHIGMTLAALLLGTTAGLAQTPGIQGVVDSLKTHGYTNIEVKREGNRVKVEAYHDGSARELTYDAGTGKIVSDESHDSGDDHSGSTGSTSSSHDSGDDHSGSTSSGTSSGHDSGDDHSSGSTSSGTSSGHDSGDDHSSGGTSSATSSGHDSGDDHSSSTSGHDASSDHSGSGDDSGHDD